jgi:rhamnogalacturonan endolyase
MAVDVLHFNATLSISFYTKKMGVVANVLLIGLAALGAASPVEQRAQKPKSFLKELGNSTWVLGNGIWNVTQNRQYADQLWSKGKDRVGDAVGHYVSYSMYRTPSVAWTVD